MDRSEGNQEDSRDSGRNRNTTDLIVTDQDEDKDEDEEVTSGQADNSVVEQLPPGATDSALSTQPTIDDPMESLGERIGAEGDGSPISRRPSSVKFEDHEGSLEELSLQDMGASASGSNLSQFILVTEVRPVQVVNRNADEKIHLESNFPHDDERINFLMNFLQRLPRQRDQDENIHNILETFETDRTLPDVDDNMANDANDYERFVSEFVYIAEQYLMNHSAVVSAVMRSLCTTAMNLQRGCLNGQLRFKKGGDIGLFLARLLSGQLSLILKDAIFGDDFFTKFDTQEHAAQLQQWIRGAFAKIIHVEIAVLTKQVESCVGDCSKPLDICITVVGPKKRSAGDPQTLKAWEVGMEEIMERNPDVNSVFSLCFPEESGNQEGTKVDGKENKMASASTTGAGTYVDKERLAELLECIVCEQVARPLLMTDCQHHICEKCCSKLEADTEEHSSIEKKKCPTCRKVGPVPNKLFTLLEGHSLHAHKIGEMIGHPEYTEDKHADTGDKPLQTGGEYSGSSNNIINITEGQDDNCAEMNRSLIKQAMLTLTSNPSQKMIKARMYPGDSVFLTENAEKVGFILDIDNPETVSVTAMFPCDRENPKEGEDRDGSFCWTGRREQVQICERPIEIPQIGDLVRYHGGKSLSQTGIRGEINGYGYLTEIGTKDAEGAEKDRMCVIEDLDGEPIEVLYSGLALESELLAKQRVKILETQVKAKIEHVDDTSQDLIVSVDGSDEQRKVTYNNVEPDRNLRSGDHVKIISKIVEAEPYDPSGAIHVPLEAGDIGVFIKLVATSRDYEDELIIELYRLPYLRIMVKMKDVEMIPRGDGMAARKKYHTILNDLFLVDRDLQDYPQALSDEQNNRDTDKDKGGKGGPSSESTSAVTKLSA